MTTLSLPDQMRFIDFTAPATADQLQIASGPTPRPGAGEVLIKVFASGVNRPDLAQRSGSYPPPPGACKILGLEVAGVIAAHHEGSKWKIGDPVCALAPGGGYAEYCVVPEHHCLPIPNGLSFEEAAGIPETYFTVWNNVFRIAKLKAGEKFLVHGGTSGIGTTAIQLARVSGAEVFATAGSAAKCAFIESLGAHAINYREQDFAAKIKGLSPNQGMNVILDMVGGSYTNKNLESLAPLGRLVQIATLQSAQATIDLRLIMARRLVLTGSTLRPRTVAEKNEIAQDLYVHAWPLFQSGRLKVIVDRVFAFDDVVKAHQHLEGGEHIGKVILTLQSQR